MDKPVAVQSLTQVVHQMLQGLDEILQAISVLEELPAARSEAESGARIKIEGILNRLHVRLARVELAVQHALPVTAERISTR
jgi:hypothetical protein